MTDEEKPFQWRRRRKRSVLGKDWMPPALTDVSMGEYCKRCKTRHGYNGAQSSRLGATYERRGDAFVLLWTCPRYGTVLAEKYLA